MPKTTTVESPTNQETKSSGGGINARVVFHAIQRHPIAFLGVIVLAAASASCVWFFLPLPKKSAAIVFHISSQPQVLFAPTIDNHIDFASYRQAQMALLKSRRTLNAALKDTDIRNLEMIRLAKPDPLIWLDKNLSVDSRSKSSGSDSSFGSVVTSAEFMRVTIDGDSEEELLAILNAVAKAYKEATDERDNSSRLKRRYDLENRHTEIKKESAYYKSEIDKIAVALGSKDGTTFLSLDTYNRDSLKTELQAHTILTQQFELATIALDSAKTAAKTAARRLAIMAVVGAISPQGGVPTPQVIPFAAIEEEIKRDPILIEHDAAVTRASKALKDAEARYEPNSPKLLSARDDVMTAEAKRAQYYTEARARAESLLKERTAQNEQTRVYSLQAEFDLIEFKLERTKSRIKDLRAEISKSNEFKGELERLNSEITQKEKVASQLADEIEKMKIEGKVTPRVTVAEESFIVPGIEGNRRLKFAILTCLGVFVVGFGGLIGWEFRSKRVTHPDEVTSALGTRLIGTIPPFTANAREASHNYSHVVLVEAIDTARTMLMHGASDGTNRRVLIVTSALSGEGKTTLAGHLAISLTRAGFRTLLVDGDMHAPSAHTLFDFPSSPGFSEVLCGEVDLANAVRRTPIPGMSVLPAGKWTMGTRQMLVGNQWRLLKREMESQFDFVVIDTSPLLLVTDTILLAREADGVILSVLLGVSQIARVAETVSRLQAVGAEVAGVVVNNVRCDINHNTYRSKYSKYPIPASVPTTEHGTRGSETKRLTDVTGLAVVPASEAMRYAEECSDEG